MTAPWGDAHVDRFWCARDGSINLDDDGFLSDPTGRWGDTLNPHVVPVDSLRQARCLVIIGEPGAGKSETLRHHSPLLPELSVGAPMPLVVVDLAEYGTEDRLTRALFDDVAVRSWRTAASGNLCVVLDSLDECQERVSHIATVLGAEIARWPTDRLILRICCRTADWPESLHGRLMKAFTHVDVFELLPLTRVGVAELCIASGVSAAQFLTSVRSVGVGPLAAKPLTLQLLLRLFQEAGEFPSDVAGLYRDALLLLAEEPEERRREAQPPGRLAATSRIAIAARLAALSTFSHRAAFWTGRPDERPEGDLAIPDCAGGTVPGPMGPVVVTEEAIRETLRTGLFTSRGASRVSWAHHTFAEHLAARFMLAHEFHEKQARSLLIAQDGQVYPQLRTVAAWLVAIAADGAFDWLVDEEPELMITTPVNVARPSVCERTLTGLFRLAATGEYRPRFGHHFNGVSYPGLDEAVAAKLREGTPQERLLALEIASSRSLPALRLELVAIVLDEAEDYQVRVGAAQALRTLSDRHPTTELTAIAAAPSGDDDPDDQLKGCALWLSWPTAMTTAEVFGALTAPRRSNLTGAYAMFIERAFPDALTETDVPAGLAWLLAVEDASERHERFDRLADRLVMLALNVLDNANVVDQLAQLALKRAQSHESLFVDNYRRDDPAPQLTLAQRHRIAATAFNQVTSDEVDRLVQYGASESGLVTRDDLAWLIDRFDAEPDQHGVISDLIGWIFHPSISGHSQLVLGLPEDHPIRTGPLAAWLNPIDLDSEIARTAREQQKRFDDLRKPTPTEPPPNNDEVDRRIRDHLDRFDQGDPSGFWQATYLLYLPPGASRFGDEIEPDLTTQPRWAVLPGDLRSRLADAARQYLDVGSCEPEAWLGKSTHWRPAHGGYQALILLLRLDPGSFANLPAAVWQEWAPIVVAAHTLNDARKWADKLSLLDLAVERAPDQVCDAAIALIKGDSSRSEAVFHEEEIAHVWSERLATWMREAVASGELNEPAAAQAAALLARNDPQSARAVLKGILANGDDDQYRAHAGALLLAHDAQASWAAVYDVLQNKPELGQQVISDHVGSVFGRDGTPALDDSDLADLYVWLVRQFPHSDDPNFEYAHAVGRREQIGRWRDDILQTLKNRGTASAVGAIRRIEQALPEISWFRSLRREAELTLRRNTWEPVAPIALLELAASAERRLVRTTEELLQVVLEALSRIQARLTGETPESHLLWDTKSGKPKAEEEISDYLRWRLHDVLVERRVVVSREVQVRSNGRGIGQRTDLRIDAVHTDDGAATPLTVIIEVKGDWNPGLTSSLRDQLVDQYMSDVGTRHGVYLVIWPDRSRTSTQKARCDALAQQTASLETDGTVVAVVHLDIARTRPGTTA